MILDQNSPVLIEVHLEGDWKHPRTMTKKFHKGKQPKLVTIYVTRGIQCHQRQQQWP